MSQDEIKQCEAQNRITFIRPNTQDGIAKNEIFNERHSGFLQTVLYVIYSLNLSANMYTCHKWLVITTAHIEHL